MEKKPHIQIFTDGACSGNPGPGGWGVILRGGGKEKELWGYSGQTTNNRMELTAVIEGLKALKYGSEVTVHTDSQYVMKGYTEWLAGWKRRGWRNGQGQPVLNRDLWEELEKEGQRHTMEWVWVRGHAGHPENERADALAVEAIKKSRQRCE